VKQGVVRQIGVSNYYPEQVRALQAYLDVPIVSNQVRISLYHLEPIYEGLDWGGALRVTASRATEYSISAWR
jgi:predicted oxidoreductase